MKAFVYDKYGSPDVLQLREIDRPVVTDNDVLVRVHAFSVNPVDWHTLTGTPYIVRMASPLCILTSWKLPGGVSGAGSVRPSSVRRLSNWPIGCSVNSSNRRH
jgi:NADPH:quinone reductase-like Zn-dependent oxidoreductase